MVRFKIKFSLLLPQWLSSYIKEPEIVEGKQGKYQRSKYKFPMPEVPPVMITVSPDNLKAVKGRVSQSAEKY